MNEHEIKLLLLTSENPARDISQKISENNKINDIKWTLFILLLCILFIGMFCIKNST